MLSPKYDVGSIYARLIQSAQRYAISTKEEIVKLRALNEKLAEENRLLREQLNNLSSIYESPYAHNR